MREEGGILHVNYPKLSTGEQPMQMTLRKEAALKTRSDVAGFYLRKARVIAHDTRL